MSLSRRSFVYGPLAAAVSGSLGTGFGRAQEGDELVTAAKREGRGTVYSVVDPTLMQAVVKRFRDKYGIEIEVMRLTSSSLGQRLSAEVESGNVAADVVIDTDKLLVQAMTAKGYYAPVEQIPGSEAFPALGQDPDIDHRRARSVLDDMEHERGRRRAQILAGTRGRDVAETDHAH